MNNSLKKWNIVKIDAQKHKYNVFDFKFGKLAFSISNNI